MTNVNQFFLRRFFKYSAFFLSPFEKLLLNRYSKNSNKKPILFILGAPRTGTTVLYQLLTYYLDVNYIDNFIYLGRENPFLSFLISQLIFKNKRDFLFSSSYGSTFREGLYAPSEAGNLWNKWMPKNKYYIKETDIEQSKLHQFSSFFNAISNKTKRPTVIKNLYFCQRLRYLKETGLNCKFIFLRRHPVYTTQSIFLARKKNNININDWWSVEPANYTNLKNLNVFEQIASQVYYIEKQINNDLKLFDKEDKITLWFEELDETKKVLEKIKNFIDSGYRKNTISPNNIYKITPNNQQKTDDFTFNQLKKSIKHLYG
jgi:hypothetical protein